MDAFRLTEAEQAVIGGLLLDPSMLTVVTEILEPQDFSIADHRTIYEAILRLAESDKPVDIITVTAEMTRTGEIESAGGAAYLANLQNAVPTAANIDHYATIVREKAEAREMSQVFEEAAVALEDHESPEAVAELAERRLRDIADRRTKADFAPIQDVLLSTFERIEYLSTLKTHVTGLSSGYPDLDKLTAGFQRKEVTIIGARPAIGKTAFALNVGQNIAVRTREPVAVFSLEMGKEQLVQRMLCSSANIDAGKMRTGQLDEDEWPKLVQAIGTLSEAPIFIDDSAGLKISEIYAKCRRLKDRHGSIGVIIIDYLQLVSPSVRSQTREQEVAQVSRMLKIMAKTLDTHVIALSQLSRSVESRQDKRPNMSDLRESGSIEQDADIVAFLYRDEYYNPETEKRNVAEVIIAKQRSGSTGTVELVFLKNFNKFVSLERAPSKPPAPPKPSPVEQQTLFGVEERIA